MSNPIILARITKLYQSGQIGGEQLAKYVEDGLITQEEADAIKG